MDENTSPESLGPTTASSSALVKGSVQDYKGRRKSSSTSNRKCGSREAKKSCINCDNTGIPCSKERFCCYACKTNNLECSYPKRLRWLHSSDVMSGEIFVPPKLEKKRRKERNQTTKNQEAQKGVLGAKTHTEAGDLFSGVNVVHDCRESPELPSVISIALATSPFAQGVISESPMESTAFDYYLHFTCPAIDPLNGCSADNLSKRLYLPLALNSLSSLHGVLAISACQLGVIRPEFIAIGLKHRSSSYKHLYKLISEVKQEDDGFDLELLASILCQVTIDITEPQAYGWLNHLKIYRELLKGTPILPVEKYGECAWYISIRLLKYDIFGCIQTGSQPLISHRELLSSEKLANTINRHWACPSVATVVCAEISHCYMGLGEIGPHYFYSVLGQFEMSLKKRFQEVKKPSSNSILQPEVEFVYDKNSDLWSMLEDIWMLAASLYFRRSLLSLAPKSEGVASLSHKLMKVVEYFPRDNFLAASLVWPIWLLVSVTYDKDKQEKLNEIMTELGHNLCIQSFYEVMKLANSYWKEDISEKFHDHYIFVVNQRNWNQLMA